MMSEDKEDAETFRKAWKNWERIAHAEHEAVLTLTTWLEKVLAAEGEMSKDSKADALTVLAQIKKGSERFPKS